MVSKKAADLEFALALSEQVDLEKLFAQNLAHLKSSHHLKLDFSRLEVAN